MSSITHIHLSELCVCVGGEDKRGVVGLWFLTMGL